MNKVTLLPWHLDPYAVVIVFECANCVAKLADFELELMLLIFQLLWMLLIWVLMLLIFSPLLVLVFCNPQ